MAGKQEEKQEVQVEDAQLPGMDEVLAGQQELFAAGMFIQIGNEVINTAQINRISLRRERVTIFFSDGSRFQVEGKGKERKALDDWLKSNVCEIK